jgi:hypothetical protein
LADEQEEEIEMCYNQQLFANKVWHFSCAFFIPFNLMKKLLLYVFVPTQKEKSPQLLKCLDSSNG